MDLFHQTYHMIRDKNKELFESKAYAQYVKDEYEKVRLDDLENFQQLHENLNSFRSAVSPKMSMAQGKVGTVWKEWWKRKIENN